MQEVDSLAYTFLTRYWCWLIGILFRTIFLSLHDLFNPATLEWATKNQIEM